MLVQNLLVIVALFSSLAGVAMDAQQGDFRLKQGAGFKPAALPIELTDPAPDCGCEEPEPKPLKASSSQDGKK